MAIVGEADREHSGHYLTAVTFVAVAVAGMAWFSQNRTLATAAAALGLYALHLLSIRFLLVNQKRQRQVLDAQWEVLQRFLGDSEADTDDGEDLVPPMPVDREHPETLSPAQPYPEEGPAEASAWTVRRTPEESAGPQDVAAAASAPAEPAEAMTAQPVVVGRLVPPIESLADIEGEPDTNDGPIASDPAIVFAEEPEFTVLDSMSENGDAEDDAPAEEPHSLGRGLVGIPTQTGSERSSRSSVEVPVPRHFALGTVALVRDLLSPAEVARVLLEQRRQPGKKFGELAVEMSLLSESQREELLLAQQEGLFTDAEMREARRRLREFRETAAQSLSGLE
jgi:hypothetical protein